MPSGGYVGFVEVDLSFPESPEGPHVLVDYGAVRVGAVYVRRFAEHGPVPGSPGAEGPDDGVAIDFALVRGYCFNAAGPGVVASDFDARADLDPVLLTFLHQTTENISGANVTAETFVQGHVYAIGLEVGPNGGEEGSGLLADVQVGSVVHRIVRLVHLLEVGGLVGLAAGDVSHLLKPEVDWVVHPDVNAVLENGVQGLGHVEVSDVAAGYTRRPRTDVALFEDQYVPSGTLPAALEIHCQVPRGAETVNSRTYNDVFSGLVSGHECASGRIGTLDFGGV